MVQGGGYAFLGMGCQCALILPDLDFVAVFVGDTQGEPNYGYTFDILKKHLSAAFKTTVQFSCDSNGKGKITFPFKNEDELEKLITLFDALKRQDN